MERTEKKLTRWRAAGVHLLISAAVAAVVLALMLNVWYPPPLFRAMGGAGLALILVGVDVVMGPALTLIVFRSGKPGLKFDLTVIALCQLAALAYGGYTIALARPAFIVFVKDQFEIATAAELEPALLAEARYPQFHAAPWSGPLLVFGDWPKESADQQRLADAALGLKDLQHFPKHYAPYDQGKGEILSKAKRLEDVRRIEPAIGKAIDAWLARAGAEEQNLLYVGLRARNAWIAVLIDRQTAQPVKMLVAERF
jgi:hypothetical protein